MVGVASRLRAGGLSGDAVAFASPSESWAAAHCQAGNPSKKPIQNSACFKSSKATPPVANWTAMYRPAGGPTPPRRLTKRQPRLPTSLAFLQVYCKKARLASWISVPATRQTGKERRWGRRTLDEHGAAAVHSRRLLPPLCLCHTKVECAHSLRLSHPVFFSRVGLKGCDSTRRLKPHCRDS